MIQIIKNHISFQQCHLSSSVLIIYIDSINFLICNLEEYLENEEATMLSNLIVHYIKLILTLLIITIIDDN